MNRISLPGLRSDSLLSYLKALGVLRLIAEQCDAQARFAFSADGGTLHFVGERTDVEAFLLTTYVPTPILNPWNSGAGFDPGSAKQTAGQTLARVRGTFSLRWQPYRAALERATFIAECVERDSSIDEKRKKAELLRQLRSQCDDASLRWLDAAVSLGREGVRYPFLLGTGGNDGRLDFSINFLQRALSVIGDESDNKVDASSTLRDALDGTSSAALTCDVAIGQFAPGSAGGVNATTGFEAQSLVNPWDFVLAIEGTLAFAGGISKRLAANSVRPSFPFAFASVASGFASASPEEKTRGELWLPRWKGAASYPAVAAFLRSGRADVDLTQSAEDARAVSAQAEDALQAAQAALTLGTAGGIEGFERIVVAERNGLAFAAVRVGFIRTDDDIDFARIARTTYRWISRVRAARDSDRLGLAARSALAAYDGAVFELASGSVTGVLRANTLQRILIALARLERALAIGRVEGIQPLQFLDVDLLEPRASRTAPLDDGSTEHRIARAFASLGASNLDERMRFDIFPTTAEGSQIIFTTARRPSEDLDPVAWLAAICEARVRRASGDGGSQTLLTGTAPINITDLSNALFGGVDWKRLQQLVYAYALVSPTHVSAQNSQLHVDDALPASFAALKLVVSRQTPAAEDKRKPPIDAEIIPLLRAGRTQAALSIVCRRLRSTGYSVRDVTTVAVDGRRYAALALAPVSSGTVEILRRSITLRDTQSISR